MEQFKKLADTTHIVVGLLLVISAISTVLGFSIPVASATAIGIFFIISSLCSGLGNMSTKDWVVNNLWNLSIALLFVTLFTPIIGLHVASTSVIFSVAFFMGSGIKYLFSFIL